VPSVGISFSGIRHLELRANAGKQYNLPSLNEKYWQPGGNPELQPESGWGGDAGVSFMPWKKELLEISVTGYAMLVNDWIQWYPVDSTGIYKATNLNKVYARGLESNLISRFNIKKISCRVSAGFAYTKSTNEDVSEMQGEAVEGKQLIYVPLCNGNVMAGVGYKGFELMYIQTFTGLRYTQTDNEDFLPAFTVAGISLGKTFNMKPCNLHLFVKVNNIWNEDYQQVPWHASPLRSFTGGIHFNFTHLKKNNI
jgi:iron complex outermembrane receptor protein